MSRVFDGVSEPVKQRLKELAVQQVKPRVQGGTWNFLRRPSADTWKARSVRRCLAHRPRHQVPDRQVGTPPLHPALRAPPRAAARPAVHRARDRHRRLPPVEGRAAPRCGCGRRSSRRRRSSGWTSRTSRSSSSHVSAPTRAARSTRSPGQDRRGRRRGAGHHRRRQPPARAHPRDVRPPVPEAGPERSLRHRGHPDLVLATVGRQQRPARPQRPRCRWSRTCSTGCTRRSSRSSTPGTSRPTPICTWRACTSTTIS